MILLEILILLIVLTFLGIVIALPVAGIVLWLSKKYKRRNTILTLLSPFVFIYTFYFCCLVGGFTCSSAFNTGCGMNGYYKTDLPNGYQIESLVDDFDRDYFNGTISKDGKCVIEWVTKIKVIGDSIYGERYFVNEAPGSEYYFVIDTKSGGITQYESFREAKEVYPSIETDLTHLEVFYYKSWVWVIPLAILAFVISSGLVFIMWFIAIIILDRFDNNQTFTIRFKNVYAYRVTLEHFRITEVIDGLTTQSQPLYEVENSSYLSEVMASGMKALYGSSLNVKHYVISTTEHIVDILTSESYIIE